MERINAVQIIGTQRSGSNLLRLMLNQIDGVYAPHPPHIIHTFYDLLPGYGNLEVDENFEALIDDVCTLVELNPVPWENLCSIRTRIFKKCLNKSLAEVFRNIYELNAQIHNANTWICKSMQNVKYLDYFKANDLVPKIIYLYRDGRDVALSFKKAIVGPKHIYSIAKKWKDEQEQSLKVIKDKNEAEAMVLSYESLIQEPEKQLHRVCDFLNIDYSNKVLEYYTSEESKRTADAGEMWINLQSPIIKGNTNKFKKGLDADEVKLFEYETRHFLKHLGYKLLYECDDKAFCFSDSDIINFEKINLKMQSDTRANASIRDLRKRGGQDDFVKELKKRLKFKAA